MQIDLLIIVVSLTLQVANVILALRLIVRTRRYLAGGVIISAVLLMVIRRTLSLDRYLSGAGFGTDIAAESVALFVSFLFLIGILYMTRIIEAEILLRREKENLIADLKNALAEIKTLEGIIPICSSCKRIRDDQGNWNRLENYIRERSDVEFSHGLCSECAVKLYPDYARDPGDKDARP